MQRGEIRYGQAMAVRDDLRMEPVQIRAGRLLLRPFRPDDAAAVHAACQDPEIPRWTSVPSPYSAEDARVFVTRTCPQGWADGVSANFAAVDAGSGELLASIGLGGIEPAVGAELGYWVAAGARGRGVASQGGALLCRWGFDSLGLPLIRWHAALGNHGSRRVAEKIGFTIAPDTREITIGQRRVEAWAGTLAPADLRELPTRPAG